MKNFIRGLPLVFAVGAGLAGCASSGFRDTSFDPSATKIHTIGLLSISPPRGFSVLHWATGGEFFQAFALGMLAGPVAGPALAMGNQEEREKSTGAAFTHAIEADNYRIETNLADALARVLESEGYHVVFVNVDRPDYAFVKTYPHVPGVDAYLDVYFDTDNLDSAGYMENFHSGNYYPYLHIAARLVDAANGDVLYSRQTVYNSGGWLPIGVNLIKPDPHYGFSSYKDLMTHVKQAIEGFQVAVGKVAQVTASDIQ